MLRITVLPASMGTRMDASNVSNLGQRIANIFNDRTISIDILKNVFLLIWFFLWGRQRDVSLKIEILI